MKNDTITKKFGDDCVSFKTGGAMTFMHLKFYFNYASIFLKHFKAVR